MNNWKHVTLFKLQRVEEINADTEQDDLFRLLYSASVIFGMTVKEIDDAGAKKAGKLIRKVKAIFEQEMRTMAPQKIGRYRMAYDVSAVTFGQYIELAYFVHNHLRNAHLILASMSRLPFRKYKTDGHRQRSEHFLGQPAEPCIGAMKAILASFEGFNRQYPHLFGIAGEASTEEAKTDPFNKRYGWQYSASAIADYEGIPLDEVYALSVRHAFNDLIYLKEKVKYEVRERDRLMEEYKLKNNVR